MEAIVLSLIDDYGRRIKKLRISLTDRCNLRCHYCMPLDSTFMPKAHYLPTLELQEILSDLKELGLEEIRLTGGEPLLRQDFSDIAAMLGELKFKRVALTTNGILLDKFLQVLRANNIEEINISLDSLNKENFAKISRGDYFERVISNIDSALAHGFQVKINTVVMKGINEHEITDFVRFASEKKINVRFLELMRIGLAADQLQQFMPAREIRAEILIHTSLKPLVDPIDSTSVNYLTEENGVIGIIASETEPFCGNCSRWRLSADGIMRACLFKEEGLNLKGITREERQYNYFKLLGMKPVTRAQYVTHQMNRIGG
jgi:cyclic pyranopterin phosphate synthase